ncbi:hypothetical protein C482_00640 [Natrialba chahannaoensis JCM 10990]|uniref:Yip1 domain-containing protein n=1 Tax=Natrialba chahannaoensis JCM 10990 TaxID=1227492 RepID=M0B9E1_9EURY|nr:YIP1 family protein [Natrialba chahannaoensis]ELZ06284.1 hypothetical protein C482_00640 [Natrialba chahannaoensis JCM 10990]
MPRTPLFDPTTYFRSRPNLLPLGAGVFVCHMVLELAGVYVFIRAFFAQVQGLDAQLERQVLSIIGIGLVFSAVIFVVAWLVVAAVMHYGSGGSATDGSFTDALAVAGWAYAPEIVFFAPSMWYGWQSLSSLSLESSDPARLAAEVDAATTQLEFTIVSMVLFLLVTSWSVYILAYGVSETHEVPVSTALAPAVLIALGSALLFVLG